MPGLAFPVAIACALAVSSFELHQKHDRHPFGDANRRALFWWAVISLADAAVAATIVAGGLAAGGFETLDELGPLSWVAIGVLGPLGLRSPVRATKVGAREEPVGLTEYYDRFRILCDRRLDERLTRLRRRDRETVISAIRSRGWSPSDLCGAADPHLDELRSRDGEETERIRGSLRAALSAPTEDETYDGLVRVLFDHRLRSVLQDAQDRSPTDADRDRGKRFEPADEASST